MQFNKKYWLIDDVVRPDDANRWEDAIADLSGGSTVSISGGNLTIVSDNTPVNPNDFFIDFIAPADYSKTQNIVINGVNYGSNIIRDIQNVLLPNGAWKAGAPIRLRVVNGQLYLTGGASGSGSGVHVGAAAPTEDSVLVWVSTSDWLLRVRTVEGSGTWTIVKGVYQG